jgi:Tol biopolymer transport system component
MALAPHSRLGPYEILDPIGSGGVGEVYKARDTRLNRTVAVKVLSPEFAADPEFRERFDREARAVSALDHPHICALYDVGEQDGLAFLVMQYLEGETLAARIARGAMPLREALPIAIQVAEALNDAHHAGLIHRDLKPANIMLVRNGSGPADAKLLDFGLAHTTTPGTSAPPSTLTAAPTVSAPLTVHGGIAGTWQYMAPELLEGKEPDARTDIFAFGCVLFEMLTGRKAFDGKTQAAVIGAIMRSEPPVVSAAQPSALPALDRLVRKSLAKDPEHRWQTAYDLLDELKWIQEAGDRAPLPDHRTAPAAGRGPAWAIAVVLLITSLGLAAALLFNRPAADTRVFRSAFAPPANLAGPVGGRLAVSPDGRRLAFVAPASGSRATMLWIRSLDGLSAQPLAGTEGGLAPFWSPDSRFIGFVAEGRLKKIDASGGPVMTLTAAADPIPGTWSEDDVILFSAANSFTSGGPILRVSAAGGTPVPATTVDSKAGETHTYPRFLPDGRHFLFLVGSQQSSATYVARLDSSERTKLLDGFANVEYANGHLLFVRNGSLMAQPFDAGRRSLSGEAVPIADQIVTGVGRQTAVGVFAAARSGVIAYQATVSTGESQLLWFDRAGKQVGALGERAPFGSEITLSPDGTRAAVVVLQAGSNFDVWLFDVMRGLRTKFTFEQAVEHNPVWSPDSSHIAFASNRTGVYDLYEKAADLSGSEEMLLTDSSNKYPETFSPDGRFLIYWNFTPTSATTTNDLWVLPLSGDHKPYPLTQTPFTEYRAQFSPDGHWVAYASNESGRFEVYAVAFPGPGGKRQVSTAGGSDPRWRGDGRELFYVTDSNTLMAAPVKSTADRLDVGEVRPLFDVKPPNGRAFYDVTRDGQRFLVNTSGEAPVMPLAIVVNWPALVGK